MAGFGLSLWRDIMRLAIAICRYEGNRKGSCFEVKPSLTSQGEVNLASVSAGCIIVQARRHLATLGCGSSKTYMIDSFTS